MRKLSQTKQFVRDVRRMRRRGKDIGKLIAGVMALLRAAPNWGVFHRNLERAFPKCRERAFPKLNDTIPLPSVAEKT